MNGRILGVSKMVTVSTRTLFLSRGNNVGPVADMTRRTITLRLDPGCETPAPRTFKRPDLLREVLAERGKFISAALTVIRAWVVAGCPATACKPIASYNRWSDWCRQPLLWLGMPAPANSIFEGMDEDPECDSLMRLLHAWHRAFHTQPTMVRDVVQRAQSLGIQVGELREILCDIAGDRDGINRRRLGWRLKRQEGRIVGDMKLVRVPGSLNGE